MSIINKKIIFFAFILFASILSINFVSADLCKGKDGYFHDCDESYVDAGRYYGGRNNYHPNYGNFYHPGSDKNSYYDKKDLDKWGDKKDYYDKYDKNKYSKYNAKKKYHNDFKIAYQKKKGDMIYCGLGFEDCSWKNKKYGNYKYKNYGWKFY